tara:strand:- start:394 stop:549 length:156 start_codon:yes stop_codon:yes gene_type:complete
VERYNFKTVEEKWQNFWDKNKSFKTELDKKKKNFIALKCFHTHQAKYIWVM